MTNTPMPEIVSPQRWQEERDGLMKAEKEATRALDALAARRRRLPMVKFDPAKYQFASSDGPVTLIDLFDGRRQLVVYQFMDVGPANFCPGCTNFTNNIVNLPSLTEYDASWANISDMPLAQIEEYKAQMGWTLPFVSSHGTSFSADCGVDNGFMLSVFLRDGDDVYRTYNTGSRGVDRLMFVTTIADLLPYGRQEDWEDSPAGWPQHPTYG
jgi:predicted dithiol-disulfide oxidoreductase (DUF899 family)